MIHSFDVSIEIYQKSNNQHISQAEDLRKVNWSSGSLAPKPPNNFQIKLHRLVVTKFSINNNKHTNYKLNKDLKCKIVWEWAIR